MNPNKPSLAAYYSDLEAESSDHGQNNCDISMEIDVDPTFEAFQRLNLSAGVRMSPQLMNHLYTLVQNDVFADDIYITLKKMYDATK